MRKPGLCTRRRSGTHVIPTLAQSCKCTGAADQGLYLRGWFREDWLRGQNLNMVLTIITINSNYTILFLIRSQVNNLIIKQTLTVKGPRKVIIYCSSWFVPLHTFSSLVTYFNSGHCTKLAVFQFVYSGPCIDKLSWFLYFVIGQWAWQGFLSVPTKEF